MNFGTGTLNIKSAKVSPSIEKIYDTYLWDDITFTIFFVLHERERTEIKNIFWRQ